MKYLLLLLSGILSSCSGYVREFHDFEKKDIALRNGSFVVVMPSTLVESKDYIVYGNPYTLVVYYKPNSTNEIQTIDFDLILKNASGEAVLDAASKRHT
ncbi:MAG: hypothetical protein AAGD22_16225 [Verrucomicrobiota bacterium]